jgi:hypothetical protein
LQKVWEQLILKKEDVKFDEHGLNLTSSRTKRFNYVATFEVKEKYRDE